MSIFEDPMFYTTVFLFFLLLACASCIIHICISISGVVSSVIVLVLLGCVCLRNQKSDVLVDYSASRKHAQNLTESESENTTKEKESEVSKKYNPLGMNLILYALHLDKYSQNFQELQISLEDLLEYDCNKFPLHDLVPDEDDSEHLKYFLENFSKRMDYNENELEVDMDTIDAFRVAYSEAEKLGEKQLHRERRKKSPRKSQENLKPKRSKTPKKSRTKSESRIFRILYVILKRLNLEVFSNNFSEVTLDQFLQLHTKENDLSSLIPVPIKRKIFVDFLQECHIELRERKEKKNLKEESEEEVDMQQLNGESENREKEVVSVLLSVSSRFKKISVLEPGMKKFPSNDVLDILQMNTQSQINDKEIVIYKTEIERRGFCDDNEFTHNVNIISPRTTITAKSDNRHDNPLSPTSIDFYNSDWSESSVLSHITPIPQKRGEFDENLIAKYGKVINRGTYGNIRIIYLDLGGSTELVKAVEKEIPITDKFSRDDIQKEVEILKMMKHPNVLTCFGSYSSSQTLKKESMDGDLEQELYYQQSSENIVLEYCPNGDLFSAKHSMTVLERLQCVFQICSGMKYLHQNNIIHKDLKTPNIMISSLGTCRIGDFGSSTKLNSYSLRDEEEMIESVSKICGTVEYLAPEIADVSLLKMPSGFYRSENDVNSNQVFFEAAKKIDIYSFGIILWEIFSLKRPYNGIRKKMGLNNYELLEEIHRRKLRPDLSCICIKSPDEKKYEQEIGFLKKIMVTCWRQNPLDRPESFEWIEKACLENIKI